MSEHVDVIVATLDDGRKANVEQTRRTVSEFTTTVTSRAKRSLEEMSAAEWDALVEDASRDD